MPHIFIQNLSSSGTIHIYKRASITKITPKFLCITPCNFTHTVKMSGSGLNKVFL